MPKIIKKRAVVKKKSIKKSFEQSLKSTMSQMVDPMTLIPSGCTTFNLECSGRIEGAFKLGKIVNNK